MPSPSARYSLAARDGVAHLEDEAVDLARGLQFVEARRAEFAAQDAVVALEQFGEEHLSRLFDDEGAELGDDEPLVRLQKG